MWSICSWYGTKPRYQQPPISASNSPALDGGVKWGHHQICSLPTLASSPHHRVFPGWYLMSYNLTVKWLFSCDTSRTCLAQSSHCSEETYLSWENQSRAHQGKIWSDLSQCSLQWVSDSVHTGEGTLLGRILCIQRYAPSSDQIIRQKNPIFHQFDMMLRSWVVSGFQLISTSYTTDRQTELIMEIILDQNWLTKTVNRISITHG